MNRFSVRLAKRFIFSLCFGLVAASAHAAEPDKMLPDSECVRYCETLGYVREECYQQCPKFRYRGNYLRDTKRYYSYRNCVQQCIMDDVNNHYYLCATQRCRVRE
jgi:hypothetical protein